MTERKLATIRRIDKLEPIEGADKILKATVGGWQLVTAKDNNFKEGQLVIYCEIDSWIPHELAPFLSKGKEPREFNGVKGERLRTIKLRGQISSGLILPLEVAIDAIRNSKRSFSTRSEAMSMLVENADVTELLGILKYEKPLPVQLAGVARGNFPSMIRKTDQERIQNLTEEFAEYKSRNLSFIITEKLEGSSMTVYHLIKDDEIDVGVCSRNLNLKETEGNAFWRIARKEQLIEKLQGLGLNIALQGELIGPNIQGNHYELKECQFKLFHVFDIDSQTYWNLDRRLDLCEKFGIEHVPVVERNVILSSVNDLLEYADGNSKLNETKSREGIVLECREDPSISFKVISNAYLLNEK